MQDGREARPFQVTWDEPEPRHERALEDFYEDFPHAGHATFVTGATFVDWVESLG